MEKYLFIVLISLIAFLGKNKSLFFATLFVFALMLIPNTQKLLNFIHQQGINWGVTIISITILIPIATGKIGFQDLINSFKSPLGIIATLCGILVAILSSKGVNLIKVSPEVTVALVLGTIIGVVFFKGIAAGPIIAAGITYFLMQGIQIFIK